MDSSSPVHNLFRRCVKCPNEAPVCPSCAKDETCSLTAQSCDTCASTKCIKIATLGTPETHHKSTPSGAIAGGVIGGVAFIVIVTFLVWRFFIRNRRRLWDEHVESELDATEKRNTISSRREARQSTRSIGSVASTVMTRASNVIQIAYIPGVTNRSPPDTPGLLVPPVPPLPLASRDSSTNSTPNFAQDQHFFLPGNIRDSTWSGLSDDRTSVSPSLARSSVATTIYRDNAVVNPLPAQQALRGKAAVVSVKSGNHSGGSSPIETARGFTPPTPAVQYSKTGSSSLTNSSSSIIARSASARPVQVTKTPSGSKVPTMSDSSASSAPSNTNAPTPPRVEIVNTESTQAKGKGKAVDISSASESESDADAQDQSRRSLMGKSNRHDSELVTMIEDSPTTKEGPFASGVSREGPSHRHKKSGSLNNLIEEAMNRASRAPTHGGLGSTAPEKAKRDLSPFSDENEVEESS